MGERAEPKGDFPQIFLKKEKQSKKENILSRKEKGTAGDQVSFTSLTRC